MLTGEARKLVNCQSNEALSTDSYSDNPNVREQARCYASCLLAMDKYSRETLSKRLSGTHFASTKIFSSSFIPYLPSIEIPPSRDDARTLDMVSRFCSKSGHLLHICVCFISLNNTLMKLIRPKPQYQQCPHSHENGQMSFLVYRKDDTCFHPVRKGKRFDVQGHHPVLAGITEQGQKMFLAYTYDPVCDSLCISDGAENVQILGEDGAYKVVDTFAVLMLRYDPHEYHDDYWYEECADGLRVTLPVGNDPTGPFSWRQYGEDDWPFWDYDPHNESEEDEMVSEEGSSDSEKD